MISSLKLILIKCLIELNGICAALSRIGLNGNFINLFILVFQLLL
jgi:hypothetical protein